MTKIVCTIGPASESEDMLRKLILAGMNVARLNFSHGTQADHKKVIDRIRNISIELGVPVAVLQDLAGPKVRIGEIKSGSISLEYGQEFILTTRKVPGDEKRVSVNYPELPSQVSTGDTILLSDGTIELKVTEVSNSDIKAKVIIGGYLSPKKGVNIPTKSLKISTFTKKDKSDLNFGIKSGIDIVALSFVKNARDILKIKKFIKKRKNQIPVIAKIEKHEALDNIDEIMEVVDGIMVARGDLGVEIPLEKVPIVQKELIFKANRAEKTVITATQMLKSMVDNSKPTRAETADVTNAILDGTDAIMLSEESAVGKYPERAVAIMTKISNNTINSSIFNNLISRLRDTDPTDDNNSLCLGACNLADNIGAQDIVVYTESGSTARHLSRNRPRQKIIALTSRLSTYRLLSLAWGVIPVLISGESFKKRDPKKLIKKKLESGLLNKGDKIIVVDDQSLKIHSIESG